MKWTVVVPTWRRPALLEQALRSLSLQSTGDFEVVVVCDGPDEGYAGARARWGDAERVRWIEHDANKGLSAARNTGAVAARGEFLLFLDDDVVADASLIARHDARHEAAAGRLVVFGRTLERREAAFASHTDRRMQLAWEGQLARYFPPGPRGGDETVGDDAERSVFFGLNCSLRRDEFLRVGGFDERLRSDEENELGWRLYRLGYRFSYEPGAAIVHANTKNMAHYFPACWSRSGAQDVYRVRELGQCGAQTRQLAAGAKASLAWHAAPMLLGAARCLESITDATDSRISFALWARARRLGEYWSSVRRAGMSAAELRERAGPRSRILMFHSLSTPQSEREARYYLPPARFRRVLKLCKALGHAFADPGGFTSSPLPPKGILLTFDDAYDDLHSELLPAMREHGIAPVIFVVAGRIGSENDWDQRQGLRARHLATLEQLRDLRDAGAVIGSHSMTHRSLRGMSPRELVAEVGDSKRRLEDVFGVPVEWFAYPFGHCDRAARAAVQDAGYRAAVTTAPGLNRWTDPMALKRIDIHAADRPWDIAGKLLTGKDLRAGLAARWSSRAGAVS